MNGAGRKGTFLHRMLALVRKELWQLRGDRAFATVLVTVPLVLLVMVVRVAGGESISANRIAIIDYDHSATSRRLIQALENTSEIRVHLYLNRLADGDRALFEGQVYGLVIIPARFERALLERTEQARVFAVVDASNTFIAMRLLGAITGAVHNLGAKMEVLPKVDVRPAEYFYATSLQSRLAPQLGFLLYQVVLMVAGLSIVRECETGTLERLLVTPLSKFEFILGKMLTPVLVGVVDFWLLFLASYIFWELPVRGSLGLLFTIALLFILAESAWGLFLSSLVTRQQQATQLIFIQILFDMAFCGYVVPVENLPGFLAWISEMLPLRHYLVCVRSILLQGGGLFDNLRPIGALVGLNLAFWTFAITSLRQRLR